MKINKILLIVITFFTTIGFISPSNAQFRDASLPQNTVALSPIFANNTGNDILDLNGNTYEVSVWDDINGSNAGIYWKCGNSTGHEILNPVGGVLDPDVALTNNGTGEVFALVTYFANNSMEFTFEVFEWNPGLQAFVSMGPIPLGPGVYEKTINIDANQIGDFIIVWDEPGLTVNCVTGSTQLGGVPDLNMGGAVLQMEPGHSPDVSIFNLTSGENQADIVYINQQGKVSIDFYLMNDLMNGTILLVNGLRSPSPDLTYRYPRIATPNSSFGDPGDFTVVVEDNDLANTWYIKGINYNACCNPALYFTIYNDGTTSNSPFNLTDYPNTRPTVAYTRNYNSIWIGWNFDNSSGLLPSPGAVMAKAPLVVIGDKHALVQPAQEYLYVPNQLFATDDISHLSLAGRNSLSSLLTFNQTNNGTIYTKSVNQNPPPTALRSSNSFNSPTAFLQSVVTAEISDQQFTMICYDLSGKIISEDYGTASQLLDVLNQHRKNGSLSFCIYKIQDYLGMNLYTGKCIANRR